MRLGQIQEYCQFVTNEDCFNSYYIKFLNKNITKIESCSKIHFKKIITKNTDVSLGDCTFLNNCFHKVKISFVFIFIEEENIH